MGKYFNPPDDIRKKGRELKYTYPPNFNELRSQLNDGEELVGLYDRGIFKNAPFIPDERELEGFESQVNRGIIFREGFFALKVG